MSVLVVGAGPTGLTLAGGLLAAGVPVRLVDAAPGPATTSRALGLQPRGVEVLNRLGALGDLPERGIEVTGVVINVDGRQVARLRVGGTTPLVTRPGVMMSQAVIEGALRRRLAELGGTIEWGHRIDDLDQAADWIVGCDGAHSSVRKLAGIGFPGVPLIERFLVADVRADLPVARDAVTTWLHGDRMLAVFPLPDGGREDLWRVLAPVAEDVEADLSGLLAERAGLPPVRACEWRSYFRIHRRLADRYRAGNVLLAGDAAHVHSPMGGQGMNTGMGDAENLAWKLALVERGRAGTALLDTYEAERRPIATEVLGNTSSITRLMLGGGPVGRVVRDHVVVPLMNTAWVQRRITEASSQLRVSYRRGPLGSAYPPFGRGPRPGDRIADLACARTDGSPTRLHGRLRGRWAVLTSDDAASRVAETHLGADHVVTLRYPKTYLVRPDGHLASAGDPHRLERWLAGALGSATPGESVLGESVPGEASGRGRPERWSARR
jgi:4,5-epoxidase